MPNKLLDFLDIQQFVGYGIDSESRSSVNLKLVRDVAAVGGHSVHGKEEFVGYFLVAHTFGNAADNFFFPLAKGLGFASLFLNCSFVSTAHGSVFLQFLLDFSDRRHEKLVLNEAM